MKTIYLLCGQSGEYEDHREWVVRAYEVEGVANEASLELNNVVRDVNEYITSFVPPTEAESVLHDEFVKTDPLVIAYRADREKALGSIPKGTPNRTSRIQSAVDSLVIPASIRRADALHSKVYRETDEHRREQMNRISLLDPETHYWYADSKYSVQPLELW